MANTNKREIVVLVLFFMTATFIIQIVGFFSPAWACKPDNDLRHNGTGCIESSLVYPHGFLAIDIVILSIIYMVASFLLTTVFIVNLVFKRRNENDYLLAVYDDVVARVVFVLFLIFQILPAIVMILCLARFGQIAWSATCFCLIGTVVSIVNIIVISIALIKLFRCCKLSVSD